MATEVAGEAVELTADDVDYVRTNFFRLEELCAGRSETLEDVRTLITEGAMPNASYTLDDGSEWFPADFFLLLDQAGSTAKVREVFARRIRDAGGTDEDVESTWASYLTGGYGWCLREVTPENMMRKAHVIETIEALLASPQSDAPAWRAQLRRAVWSLDAIERPFSPDYDRSGHLGAPPSRDRYVETPRQLYPQAFEVQLTMLMPFLGEQPR
jgi:hypothetical protein